MFHLLTIKFGPVNPKSSKGAGKLVHYQKFAAYHTVVKSTTTTSKNLYKVQHNQRCQPPAGDLRCGDFSFITPRHRTNPNSPKKKQSPLSSIKSTSIPPNEFRASNVHLNLIAGKKGRRFPKSSEDFLS